MKTQEQVQAEIDEINKYRIKHKMPLYTYEDYLSNVYLSDKLRRVVMERDNFKCHYCGAGYPKVKLGIDHKTPRSRKGNNDLTNLITTCIPCNSKKMDKTYEEYLMYKESFNEKQKR